MSPSKREKRIHFLFFNLNTFYLRTRKKDQQLTFSSRTWGRAWFPIYKNYHNLNFDLNKINFKLLSLSENFHLCLYHHLPRRPIMFQETLLRLNISCHAYLYII